MQLVLLSAVLALLAGAPGCQGSAGGNTPSAPKANSPRYTVELANFTNQWTLSLERRESAAEPFRIHTCNATVLGAPCNQPPIIEHTDNEVKIVFARRNASAGTLRTWKAGTPTEIKLRLDYAPSVQIDRGWRKKNQAYPGHGWHAKWTVATLPYAESGAGVWQLSGADEVTDAVLYPEICVICTFTDGSSDYCQCDRRNGAANFLSIETVVSGSITPEMRAAAIAMSVFSPIFLIIYAVSDNLYYKKTGRSLRVAS